MRNVLIDVLMLVFVVAPVAILQLPAIKSAMQTFKQSLKNRLANH